MNEIMMRTVVLLVTGVLFLVGQGCSRQDPIEESFLPVGRNTISNNVAVASRILGRIQEEKDDQVRQKMLAQLSRRVSEIDYADLDFYNCPYSLVQEYFRFVWRVAELMRDEVAPEVVIDLLHSSLKRVEHEEGSLKEWTRRWCAVVPDRSIPSMDDPRLWKNPHVDRDLILLSIHKMKESRLSHETRYNARQIDIMRDDVERYIEERVVPYYAHLAVNTNNAESAVKRFTELFGRTPTKRKRWLPWIHWE